MLTNFINQTHIAIVIFLLIMGFVFLIKGADFFVEGSSSIAKKFKVPGIVIGLTVVAMGTSLPETAVSVTASLAGNNELAISNAVGSNIFNTMMVIGVCAIITPIMVQKQTIKRDIPFAAIVSLLLLGLGILGLGDKSGMVLGHLDGAILLVLFTAYIVFLVVTTLKARKNGAAVSVEGGDDSEIKLLPMWKSILFILLGGAGIALGGELTVDAASRIASDLGMSQTLIGLTIVSIGTSLPELVTSIVAAKKKELDMALGNAIGSNIFNFLMVLGIASAISPIGVITFNIIDIAILLVFTLVVWLFAATKKSIGRLEGIIMVALYVGYAAYIIIR